MSAWILHSVLRPPWRMTGVGTSGLTVSNKAPVIKLGRLRENRLQSKDSVGFSRFGLN